MLELVFVCRSFDVQRCNPWPHVANRQLLSLSFAHLAPTALAAPVLIMTSFATELAMPSVTDVYVTYGHLTAFNIIKMSQPL